MLSKQHIKIARTIVIISWWVVFAAYTTASTGAADYIRSVSEPQTLYGKKTTATLRANVISGDENIGITRVWAEIIPPDPTGENPVSELHDPDNDGIYEGTYDGFITEGSYIILIYASDTENVTSPPAQTFVTRAELNADDYEEDDRFSQADTVIINESPGHHNFHDAGDEDWVKFYGIAGETYYIRVNNRTHTCDTVIEIYDTDGTTLLIATENKDTAGKEEVLDWESPRDGVFYVRLRNLNPDFFGAYISYDLEVYKKTGDFWGDLVGAITDAHTGEPIREAVVKTDDGFSNFGYPDGTYWIYKKPGHFTVGVEAPGYESSTRYVSMDDGEVITEDFELEPSGPEWVKISGTVLNDEGTPLCAMVLANGQHTFSCEGDGRYDLEVPQDENGEITLFAFCDGLAPFREILGPEKAADIDITMQPAAPNSRYMTLTADTEPAESGLVRISGTVTDEDGTPLCAMVLANGQHTFSCEGDGRYDLEVPQDENGEITLFGFCDGVQPFKQILKP
ncbi:carboxypeptidase-like regulatory domain-containing protein [Desulfococcaceae bacterium HSG8]|nr:carboxypeptidase-like regulatory domain-containing protein [Desulfococcaceae bacterium HSG8]